VRRAATVVGPWLALLLLTLWARNPDPERLALAVVGGALAVAVASARSRWVGAGIVVTVTGVLLAFIAQGQDRRLALDWERYWDQREAQLARELERRLDDLLDRSTSTASRLASAAAAGKLPSHGAVEGWRSEAALSALMLYDADGRLRIWAGDHRGRVPEAVQAGREPYLFNEVPLGSYLYVTLPVPDGGTAVAASLLRSDLSPRETGETDLVSRFRAATGETLRLAAPDRPVSGEVYDYVWEGAVLFSVALEEPLLEVRRAEVRTRGSAAVAVVVVLAWLLLAVGTGRGDGRAPLAAAAGVLLALLLPMELLPFLEALADPADFWFPGTGGSLARVLVLLAALAVVVLTRLPGWSLRLHPAVGAVAVAGGVPLLVHLFGRAASPGFLAAHEGGWVAYQLALAGSILLLVWSILLLLRPPEVRPGGRVTGVALTLFLGVVLAVGAVARTPLPPLTLALFGVAVPFLAVPGLREQGRTALIGWALTGLLASAVALPLAWEQRLEARIATASLQVDRLGSGVDPYLRYLLGRLGLSARVADGLGASPVELLYRSWRESGLTEAGYPVWLTLWSDSDFPQDLRIGTGLAERPAAADRWLDDVRGADTVQIRRLDGVDAHYLVLVPLADARVLTGVVPPLGLTRVDAPLGPLFGQLGPGQRSPLELVPLLPGEDPGELDVLRWIRVEGGWQGEVALQVGDARYHAHFRVPVAGPAVLGARASLTLAGNLGFFALSWLLAGLLAGRTGAPGNQILRVFSSFRGRVTFALFAFFALSNLIFGSLAYRTIAGASQRAARVLSERAVGEAATAYAEEGGMMGLLARRVGADLLEFRDGELVEGSVDELVELGLYQGWLPYPVHQALAARETLQRTSAEAVGGWDYVVAYRRLPDGDVLGAPVPLQAGATAVASAEVAALLSAAILVGGLLSLLLALGVGRALTQPIRTLRVASERVGSGNLAVRLEAERTDEFGTVFEAFNRMVRRLRRARSELVRTSRRTQAIVEEAATGVVAFDAEGRVTLVNPRARSLLGLPLEPGAPLPRESARGSGFVEWMDQYFRDGLVEAGSEFQQGERRLRVRARRITREGPLAGAVVILEDVTDELRTERILAWGEMARQVAHEVKNPLTPIKLSVQHVRRAWHDGRSDFDTILERNVEAVLREIDRLAAIATSFSRFGAPAATGEDPLHVVQLGSVVREVLALYGGDEGPVRFVAAMDPELPRVWARETEVKEVLVNLLENARAAVSEAGEVRIAGYVETREGGGEGGARVVLEVRDDGVGIAPDLLPRIFEPHFSTRSAGTGLGLAIVHRLVTSWGGEVTATSRSGEGTVMRVRFRPLRAPAPPAVGADGGLPTDGPPRVPGGGPERTDPTT
jgi:signal transduction histidine kinase/HAMP domain-containing protein